MRRITIINQKGGVGKTTTTANLGAALVRAGRRVLLIDLDPQAHLTLHFGQEFTDEQPTIYDVITGEAALTNALLPVSDKLDLVPADIDLAAAETELVSVTGREVLLREAIDGIDGRYDVLLIDCPPALGILTVNALAACSEVLVPLQAHFFGLQGLGKLLDTIGLVRQRIHPQLRVTGVMLCMHEATTRLAGEVVDDVQRFLESARGTPVAWAEARVFSSHIRRNIKLAEASSYGQTVFDYAPRSNGAMDYACLAGEIFGFDPSSILPAPDEAEESGETRRLRIDSPARSTCEAIAGPSSNTDANEAPSRHEQDSGVGAVGSTRMD